MNTGTSPTLFLLPVLFLFDHRLISALNINAMPSVDFIPSPRPGSQPLTKGSDFIRSSCKCTSYPDLCYASLKAYSSSIHEDPVELACVAIGVSLKKVKKMSSYLANLSRKGDIHSDPRASSALQDCVSLFGDVVDEIQDSLKQMHDLGSAGSSKERLRFLLSNVQTWMSAALTYQETCTDDFDDVADKPLKSDVINKCAYVKKLTSNALALVNDYAEKATS
ncbi:pectinesterase inhibitor 7-like [Mangifera indica]|uniref:pectinesterase inhibitor 7-like n=1 Tax=Mangifera indica TaxID=29780 RepID=UPI001CFA005D|nr:pectinesterase inhibitor 7-like [Mangifera indica]